MKSPLLYEQDMQGEIGLCFSALRNEVENLVKQLYEDPWVGVANPNSIIDKVLQAPIIKDTPTHNDMPDEKKIYRQAELGMWIAWANVRDIDYWETRTKDAKEGRISSGMVAPF